MGCALKERTGGEVGMSIIKRVEDLYNEKIYFMEIKPHKAENGLVEIKENELFPVVFYGLTYVHTVKNRCYIRVGAKYVCENTYLKSRLPINGYGVWWRCWEEKPTEEQRQAVKWDV